MNLHFQDMWILLAIPVMVLVVYFTRRRIEHPGITFSSGEFFKAKKKSLPVFLSEHLYVLRILALTLLIVGVARPQAPLEESKVESEGIDIVLAVDVSSSMLAEDFTVNKKRANRLAAVKEVVRDFVNGRTNDRIGLVAFAARPYTVCPLTLDYGWLLENLDRLTIGIIEDGTAIGSGLSTALNRLKDTKAKGKVVVLLTDGRNNAGNISPQTAAEAAKALGVKVYTIGAGTKGHAPFPVKDFFGNTVYRPVEIDIDEETLTMIASTTNAQYFRATDTASLKKIYKEIDRLETTPIEEKGYLEYQELFVYFVLAGLVVLLLAIILENTFLRVLP